MVEGGNDNGLRCTYNEPKLSDDLGVKLLEDDDGQAVVVKVIPESTAERSGVKIGDKLSVSVAAILCFAFAFPTIIQINHIRLHYFISVLCTTKQHISRI